MKQKKKVWMKHTPEITLFCRILTGAVFVFSGFVKAVDPWGTLYKIQDYLAVLGWNVWPNLVVAGAVLLCCVEFMLGVMLLLGCYRRATPVMLAAFMVVMLPLTLWIAVADPVEDCGCFGDALIISNWATFWKNVALSAMIVWLLRHNLSVRCVVIPYLQWIALSVTGGFIGYIALAGFSAQPLIDFRPYKIGSPIVETGLSASAGDESDEADEADDMVFIYEKDGVKQEFGIDEIPDEDDGWTFVDRKNVKTAPSSDSPADKKKRTDGHQRNLRIWSEDGQADFTDSVASPHGRRIFLMMPDLGGVTPATTWRINSLYSWAQANNIDMIAVVSGDEEHIALWKDLSLAAYPIYTADDTQIKEVVRGNPAVVYTEDGVIVWKSSLKSLNVDDFQSPQASSNPRIFITDSKGILLNASAIYLIALAILIFLSFSPAMVRMAFRYSSKARKLGSGDKATRDDKARPEE